MAVQQVAAAYQNDGNFCQLDLQDTAAKGPIMRIETFRASQPSGEFGKTKSGTPVELLAGADHLQSHSNRVFRHLYSWTKQGRQVAVFEMREQFTPSGGFEVRIRDIDSESESFGTTLVCVSSPKPGNAYSIRYELRAPAKVKRVRVHSPLERSVSSITGLGDIGGPIDSCGEIDASLKGNPMSANIQWNGPKSSINASFADFDRILQDTPKFATFKDNALNYLRMGDFRDKCIHDGTNLTGPNPRLASEYLLIRAYRKSLIMLGRVIDADMYKHTLGMMSPVFGGNAIRTDPKPGVYTPFLTAYMANVEHYQLGLDKVHSDYGGVPMKQSPGSRLENGATPEVDATRLNRSLAEIAFAFYVNPHPVSARAIASLFA